MLALLSCGAITQAADVTKAETPKPSLLDGLYLDGIGVMRKANITGKGDYGAGAELGLVLNKHVSIGVQNIGYATPDHWRGSAIDETSGIAHWTLFTSDNKKVTFGGLGSVTYSYAQSAWALGAGVEGKYNFAKNLSAGIGAQIRFWNNEQKEDLLMSASVGYKF